MVSNRPFDSQSFYSVDALLPGSLLNYFPRYYKKLENNTNRFFYGSSQPSAERQNKFYLKPS